MAMPADDNRLVQIVDAALADAARRAGPWLVCRPGCTPCCHGAFAINVLDAARLRAGMEVLRIAQPILAADLERRAHLWIAQHAAHFPGDPLTGRLGETDSERELFEEFATEAACPALNPVTGHCDVYTSRPMTCRVFGPPVRVESGSATPAIGHCELCFAGASHAEVEACEMQVPHRLEADLLSGFEDAGDTVVAFALRS
jgi:Fe-S-cluster containining protein